MAGGWRSLWHKILNWHHPVAVTTPAAATVIYGPVSFVNATDELTVVDSTSILSTMDVTDEVTFTEV